MEIRFEDTLPSHGEYQLSDCFFVVRIWEKGVFLDTGSTLSQRGRQNCPPSIGKC